MADDRGDRRIGRRALALLVYTTVRSIVNENWQSEFLQSFSFVTLAALYIHKGSAESKDSDENMEASLRRIEQYLGTLPPEAPEGEHSWKPPDTPLQDKD